MTKNNKNTKAQGADEATKTEGLDPAVEARIPVSRMESEANVHFGDVDATDPGPVQLAPEQELTVEAPATEAVNADIAVDARWPLDVWHDVVLTKVGQPSFVLTAALMGEDQDAEYSEAEVRSLVEKFLNTPAR